MGLDINTKVCTDLSFQKGINVYCRDATTVDDSFLDQFGTFDIIIDDASHDSIHITRTFEKLFPILKVGGLYIVEDVQESYKDHNHGGLKAMHSTMEYFKGLTDLINFYYIPSSEQTMFESDYLSIYGSKNLNYFVTWIKSVLFTEVLIIVAKRSTERSGFSKNCLTGKKSLVEFFHPDLKAKMRCFDERILL